MFPQDSAQPTLYTAIYTCLFTQKKREKRGLLAILTLAVYLWQRTLRWVNLTDDPSLPFSRTVTKVHTDYLRTKIQHYVLGIRLCKSRALLWQGLITERAQTSKVLC